MNLALDEVIRRVAHDVGFRAAATDSWRQAAGLAGVSPSDLRAVVEGDLVALYQRGAHPLLIMQLAGALGIDPMQRYGTDAPTQDPSRGRG